MGLPGSGKTTLANLLSKRLQADWFNADEVRKQNEDWDFSITGRIRQSERMRALCDASTKEFAIADFVCPLPEMRENFSAHWTIWLDTIQESRYTDTNKAFNPPSSYDFRLSTRDAEMWALFISEYILAITAERCVIRTSEV
jgi:adenylylsulfate kinase